MTHFDMVANLPGLLQVEDRVSMAVSIESRVPLLDRRIVDLISHMPAGMKFKGGEMKYLLKRTIKNMIPEKIMNRKDKMGFPVPLHIWTKSKAKSFILDALLSKDARERNIVDPKHVENMLSSEQPFSRAFYGGYCAWSCSISNSLIINKGFSKTQTEFIFTPYLTPVMVVLVKTRVFCT